MSEAVEAGGVELWTTPVEKWFPRAEMMAKAVAIWPLHVIEEALADDADGVLRQAIRCAELRVRLPRHHIDMLEYRADQQETTVSGVLARELDSIARALIEELSAALPRFAEAMAWPTISRGTQMSADKDQICGHLRNLRIATRRCAALVSVAARRSARSAREC